MNTVFANTSLHWAYSKIHMAYAASKADIWRYAVLYTYGGMYIDDDSDMKTPLDEVHDGSIWMPINQPNSTDNVTV